MPKRPQSKQLRGLTFIIHKDLLNVIGFLQLFHMPEFEKAALD
jgi:hypothetical protein